MIHLFKQTLQDAIDKGLDEKNIEAKNIIVKHIEEINQEEHILFKLKKNLDDYHELLEKAVRFYARGEGGKGNKLVAYAKVKLELIHDKSKELIKEEKKLE